MISHCTHPCSGTCLAQNNNQFCIDIDALLLTLKLGDALLYSEARDTDRTHLVLTALEAKDSPDAK
jgi:hypothetical protein